MLKILTPMTELLGCDLPIIGAPMFLVSNVAMVTAVSEAGGIGVVPSLNYRPLENYQKALSEIRSRTNKPFGINIIVNKSNTRQKEDLRLALEAGARLIMTSLGNPGEVIKEAHRHGAKVFCDVTTLEHARKVEELGADGVVAVAAGAGGHAGPISPVVLIPWLKRHLHIPIIAAGGVAHGASMAAMLALGASGVSVGTRFIASTEAQVDDAYKLAIVNGSPEDIVMTSRISGTPAAVINTPYVRSMGLDLPWALRLLKDHPKTKKYVTSLIYYLGMQKLEKAATRPTWKEVWSAGQSVGLVDEILSCREIVDKLVGEYQDAVGSLPAVNPSL